MNKLLIPVSALHHGPQRQPMRRRHHNIYDEKIEGCAGVQTREALHRRGGRCGSVAFMSDFCAGKPIVFGNCLFLSQLWVLFCICCSTLNQTMFLRTKLAPVFGPVQPQNYPHYFHEDPFKSNHVSPNIDHGVAWAFTFVTLFSLPLSVALARLFRDERGVGITLLAAGQEQPSGTSHDQ